MNPVRLLLLLPLFVLIGFEATLFSNLPYEWKIGGCPAPGSLIACSPISFDWSNYAKDMAFYTLLCYWSIVVAIGVRQRLSLQPTVRFWKRQVLKGRFKLAFLGALMML